MASALWRRRHENGLAHAEAPPAALRGEDGSLRLRAQVPDHAEGVADDWWRYSTIGREVSAGTIWHFRADAEGAVSR